MIELSKLKICFIAGTLGCGGAERQLYYTVKTLKAAGAEITVLSLTQGEFWEEKIKGLLIPVVWVGRHRSRAMRALTVISEVAKRRPQIVQSQHSYANLYAVLAARICGAIDIGAVRNDGRFELSGKTRGFRRWSLCLPKVVAVNSHAAIRNLTGFGISADKLIYLRNVVDAVHFSPAPKTPNAVPSLLFIGRFRKEKRLDRLLRVLAVLSECGKAPFRARLVGEGPEEQMLHSLAASLKLPPDRVTFEGLAEEPLALYRHADVLVLTSDHEGTPNVVLEAMACGLPVVATSVGEVPAIVVNGKTGAVVPTEDETALAAALERMIADAPERIRMGKAAREFVLQEHGLERYAGSLLELYTRVLNGGTLSHAEA